MSNENETTCPNCGALMPEGIESCSHCGALLPQPQSTATAPTPVVQTAPEPEPLSAPEPLPEPVPPTPAPALPVQVKRTTSLKLNLKISQEAVDKQGWLAPEQWDRLLEQFQQALANRLLQADWQSGQPLDVAAESSGLAIRWEEVGDQLTDAQHAELEQGLQRLVASVGSIPGATPEVVTSPERTKASVSCSTTLFVVGIMAAAVTCHFLMH